MVNDNSAIVNPFDAYDGEEPYIFISYKHIDSEIVFPVIKQFHDEGFNIWYDDGLHYGQDYDDLIVEKIENASLFVVCITENVIKNAHKESEYMKKELQIAIDEIPVFPIYLEDVELEGKYKLHLKGMHSIFRHEYGGNEERFINECVKAFKDDFGVEKSNYHYGFSFYELRERLQLINNYSFNKYSSVFSHKMISQINFENFQPPEIETSTIDYAIDLGTTSSIMARTRNGQVSIVAGGLDRNDFVGSAVYIDAEGRVFIGDMARNKIARDSRNGFSEFKLKMGLDHIYEFEASGCRMTPVQLTAEILKNLRENANELYGIDLKASVITVPADFNNLQMDDTVRAAQLAGFKDAVLLQEPIAATIAYGFDKFEEDEIWMVYDFGGATFDVSIIKKSSKGLMNINNKSDVYFGGTLIDIKIVDKILAPAVRDSLGLNDFYRENDKYSKQFARLIEVAEIAKGDLDADSQSQLEIENFYVAEDGEVFDFDYVLTREELDRVMKPLVFRTIRHCHKALEDINLGPSDISRIVLVGGSSLIPYVHQMLTEEFEIPLEYSIDPRTVVVRGAAVYAGTIAYAQPQSYSPREVTVEIDYDGEGKNSSFDVSGSLTRNDGGCNGFSIEFINTKTRYESGRILTDDEGKFRQCLLADDDGVNVFEIKAYDDSGNMLRLSQTSVKEIRYDFISNPSRQVLESSITLNKGGPYIIAKKGVPLPYKFVDNLKSAITLHSGNPSEAICLPFYSEDNLIGYLRITGEEIKSDLPAGSNLELTFTIDESGNIDASIDIEVLNQDFFNFEAVENDDSQ